MKHEVALELQDTIMGWPSRKNNDRYSLPRIEEQMIAYRNAELESWEYREKHGGSGLSDYGRHYDSHLPVSTVLTLRAIANRNDVKLNKAAVKYLERHGFIISHRNKWKLAAKGELTIKYYDEHDAWKKRQTEKRLAKLLQDVPEMTREEGLVLADYDRGFAGSTDDARDWLVYYREYQSRGQGMSDNKS